MTELEGRIGRLEQMQHRVMKMLEDIAHPNEGRLYNVDDAAVMLSVKPATLREWLRSGKVKAVKLGNTWKISDNELRRLINSES
jgi:excisionase family DNA binding protein